MLGPAVLLTAISLPVFIPSWTTARVLLMVWMEALFVSFLLVLINPKRFWWAGRIAAGCTAGGYAAYLIYELWTRPESIWPPGRRSSTSALNAALGMLVFGFPCGMYALLGRWPFARSSRFDDTEMPLSGGVVSFDDERLTHARARGTVETILWHDLREVVLITTSGGPFVEDVFYVLRDSHGEAVIPQTASGSDALLTRLSQLPGFNEAAVIEAMGCTHDREFVCWRRDDASSHRE